MQYYYQPDLQVSEKHFALTPDESHHAVKVLRHNAGDVLNILNGRGGKFTARILETHPKGCAMEVIGFTEEAAYNPHIHIALSLIKSRERIEWFLEKAIEIGVTELSFFTSHQSEKRGLNEERLQKIAVSALKQSGNTWLPKINALTSFDKLIKSEVPGMKFIAYCPVEETIHLNTQYKPGNDAIILIGPEGDFSETEVKAAIGKGFKEVSLGKNRLRSETAALVSLLALKLRNI